MSVDKFIGRGYNMWITIWDLPSLWHGVYTPPPPSRIPPYICQNVRYGGIIPYITQIKILGKNYPFSPPVCAGEHVSKTRPPVLKRYYIMKKNF
jgi:hypothetical protein